MDEFSTDTAVQRYLPLMHELAIRIDIVARACDGKLNLTPPFAREFAYLQFRRMCELIALGCLLLHGDLPVARTQSTRKEWNAEKIMRSLHRDYPHSFPQSVSIDNSTGTWRVTCNSKPNALTLDEFRNLYNECGEVLHRGTIRSLESEAGISFASYQRVLDWQGKMVDLMNQHFVGRSNTNGFYVVSLRTESGFPECNICTFNKSGGIDLAVRKMTIRG